MEPFATDAELLARSATQPAPFSLVYERHVKAVARYVTRRVGNEAAEDLTAEIFVRAFRARGRYRVEYDSALPWLLGVAHHVIADHRRAEKRRLSALERLAASSPRTVEDKSSMLSAEVVRALRQLPSRDRDTLLLVVWGELSYDEAAVALKVPIGTVRSRIARARQRLAAAMQAHDSIPHPPELALNGETHV